MSWTAVLLALLTVSDQDGFTLLDPGSSGQWTLLGWYLTTSAGLVLYPRSAAPVYGHLLAVGALILFHPITRVLGRDGTFAVASLHAGFVLIWLSSWRPERKLLPLATLFSIALAETLLSVGGSATAQKKLPDYSAVMGPYGAGGFLVPGLHMQVVGSYGPVEFVTESHGFRNREEITLRKTDGRRRVFLVGDSFVAGYRTDQERTVGRVLEQELRRRGISVEVPIVGVGHPGAALEWLTQHGFGFDPDLVVLGITLGNDLSQSWLDRRQHPVETLDRLFLPRDAFVKGLDRIVIQLDRTLRRWRWYRRGRALLATEVISSWFYDIPGHVHLFDPGHSLGHFFTRRPLAPVEESFKDVLSTLEDIQAACAAKHTPLLVTLFPQRFQMSPEEWAATGFEYGLDLYAFDRGRPNRVLLQGCSAARVGCADLLPGFSREPGPLYQPRGDMHWNDRGHAVAGRLLAEEIARRFPSLFPSESSSATTGSRRP